MFSAAQVERLTTRESGRCSWTRRKAKAPAQPRQALEDWAVMALFAIADQSEATSRG
nr:hypothetical protein [Planococcus glaciei]